MRTSSSLTFAAATLAVAILGYACGSSGTDLVGKCVPVCEKYKSCNPEIALFIADCRTFCQQSVSSSTGGSSGKACKDEAAAIAKFDQCSKVECSALEACIESVATICGDTTGTGGVSGGTGGITGGTGGKSGATGGITGATGGTTSATGGKSGATGGASGAGGATGADCTKAYNCCVAYVATVGAPASTCAAIQGQSAAVCQGLFTTYAQQASTLPACQ